MKIKWLIMGLVILVGVLAWPELPDTIPTHWGVDGEVDGYGSRLTIWLLPAIMFGLLLLFKVLPKIDPKKANYQKFLVEYEWIQIAIISVFAYIFILQVFSGLYEGFAEHTARLIYAGIGLMFILLGSPMRTLKQNFFVGIRTPWTLTSVKSWKKTHELGGRLFIALGLVMLVDAVFDWQSIWVLLGGILGVVVFLVVYSYYAAKK